MKSIYLTRLSLLNTILKEFFISGNDEEDAVIEEESLSGTPEVVEDEVVADTENLEEEEKSGGVELAGVDDGLMQ